MTTGRYSRRPAPQRPNSAPQRPDSARRTPREENFFFGMIGCSIAIHLLAAATLLRTPPPPPIVYRPPTIFVDLVLPPVANPQRGDAGGTRKIAAPREVEPIPAVPTKAAKEAVVLKGKGLQQEPVAKVDDIGAEIAKMRRRVADRSELQETQNAIATLKNKTKATAPTAVAGSAAGTGDEAGSERNAWLQSAVKAKWNWTERKRKDLRAEVEVEFDSAGKLSNYRIIRTSGVALFDKSLLNALLKLDPLPKTLRKPFKETILFNLEDLQRP